VGRVQVFALFTLDRAALSSISFTISGDEMAMNGIIDADTLIAESREDLSPELVKKMLI